MNRYDRAYKDARSPLTPIAPLPWNTFDFNIDSEEPSCSRRLATTGNSVRHSAIPRVRQRIPSCSSSTRRTCTPQSSDSVRQKRNNYVEMMASIGSELLGTPLPPVRAKRGSNKPQTLGSIPTIVLQPPPRIKRRQSGNRACQCTEVKREYRFEESEEFNNTWETQSTQNSLAVASQSSTGPRRFDRSTIRLSSPVSPRPMSPRFGEFLMRWGINCLKSIFERQEIDLQTFLCLTADDLELLGIQDPTYRQRVMEAINFVTNLGRNREFC